MQPALLDESELLSKFSSTYNRFIFLKPKQNQRQKRLEEAKQPKKIKYKGQYCTKADVEDFLKRFAKAVPREPDSDDCCYARPKCRNCVFTVYDRKVAQYK